MTNLFTEIGMLEVIIGRGSITAYEITRLKPGDVVKVTDREAGAPVSIAFNSQLFASGEILVTSGLFAVRIVKTGWNYPQLPFAGEVDDVAELLEFQIRLAAIPMTLKELIGVGEHTVINLGKEATQSASVELVVAKTPVATGHASHSAEKFRFGMRIEEVHHDGNESFDVYTSGSLDGTAVYDVKPLAYSGIPDKFTIEQIRSVSKIHERFAFNLCGSFGTLSDYHVAFVDQTGFGKLSEFTPNDAFCAIVEAMPLRQKAEISSNKKYVLQSASTKNRLSDDTVLELEMKERQYDQATPLKTMLCFYQSRGRFSQIVEDEAQWSLVLTALRNAWKLRFRMAPLGHTRTEKKADQSFYSEMEHMLVVGIEGHNESILLVYPSVYLERILDLLTD